MTQQKILDKDGTSQRPTVHQASLVRLNGQLTERYGSEVALAIMSYAEENPPPYLEALLTPGGEVNGRIQRCIDAIGATNLAARITEVGGEYILYDRLPHDAMMRDMRRIGREAQGRLQASGKWQNEVDAQAEIGRRVEATRLT